MNGSIMIKKDAVMYNTYTSGNKLKVGYSSLEFFLSNINMEMHVNQEGCHTLFPHPTLTKHYNQHPANNPV